MTVNVQFVIALNIVPELDNEMFSKALNAYAHDTKKNLQNLSAYAKKLRVYKKVTELYGGAAQWLILLRPCLHD